jgi:tellurium resistance protein TerZ
MSINLSKGQKINLAKENGKKLERICFGLNWGMIEKSSFFGSRKESVDLDGSCAIFDQNKNLIDVIYYGNLKSKDKTILHSGDDLTGDDEADDIDNEIIQVDLTNLSPDIDQIVFVLNSYKGQDFATIPYARIRIFEGNFDKVDEVFATYDIAQDSQFGGFVSMIMGKVYKRNGEWKFSAIGTPTTDQNLELTVKTVQEKYL